jgi:alanyl-tRNA synthetase
VLQGKVNNFDADIFRPILQAIELHAKTTYGKDKDTDTSMRVIADHIRGIVFLISEGLMPSNEGRGYVLRRIIRRASRHSRLLNVHEPFLYKLIDAVTGEMGEIYPEIVDGHERTEKLLKIEEERFAKTIEMGMKFSQGLKRKAVLLFREKRFLNSMIPLAFLLTLHVILRWILDYELTKMHSTGRWIYREKGQGLHGLEKKRQWLPFTGN